MAGEMFEATRDEWPTHYAVAEAVGGEVKPFDYYQGPYICIDDRGVHLWLTDEGVYREDNDTLTPCFVYDEMSVVEAAEIAMGLIEDERE